MLTEFRKLILCRRARRAGDLFAAKSLLLRSAKADVNMAAKLNTGDAFPKLTLDLVDGGKLALPDDLDARYKVILFYRGHW